MYVCWIRRTTTAPGQLTRPQIQSRSARCGDTIRREGSSVRAYVRPPQAPAPKYSAPVHSPLRAKPLPLPRCCGAQQPQPSNVVVHACHDGRRPPSPHIRSAHLSDTPVAPLLAAAFRPRRLQHGSTSAPPALCIARHACTLRPRRQGLRSNVLTLERHFWYSAAVRRRAGRC